MSQEIKSEFILTLPRRNGASPSQFRARHSQKRGEPTIGSPLFYMIKSNIE